MKKRDKSPCVDVCQYQGPHGWCLACGMTSKESKAWRTMKPYDKASLNKKLQQRKAELKAQGLEPS